MALVNCPRCGVELDGGYCRNEACPEVKEAAAAITTGSEMEEWDLKGAAPESIMRDIARTMDAMFNPANVQIGFVVLLFPLGQYPTVLNYVSNVDRAIMKAMLEMQLAQWDRLDEQPEGSA